MKTSPSKSDLITSTTDRLTGVYLQKLERENFIARTGVLVLFTLSFFWLFFRLGGADITGLFSNIMFSVCTLVGGCFTGLTAYRVRSGPVKLARPLYISWLLISSALILDSITNIYYTYLATTKQSTQGGLVDLGFTCIYPLLFVGALIMPTALRFRIRMGLDALITTLSILGISWFFALGPAYEYLVQQHTSILDTLVALVNPFWDMLLLLAIVLVIRKRPDSLLQTSYIMAGIAMLSNIWADITYAYLTIFSKYTDGMYSVDPLWFLSALLLGLAALHQYEKIARRAYSEKEHPQQMAVQLEQAEHHAEKHISRHFMLLQNALISLPLAVLLLLTVYSDLTTDTGISSFLITLSAIVSILVAIRYILASYENEILLQGRKHQHEVSEHLRLLGTRLVNILDMNQLLDQIVRQAASEFDFDAALLLVIEDYDEQERHRQLHIRAAATRCPEAGNWYIQGERLPYCPLSQGKEIEVHWQEQPIALPEEVEVWRSKHNVDTTLFVPLIFHDLILGSLGFCRYTTRPISQQEREIARAYTVQAATFIQHSRLYQKARNQEAFAGALANIARRLNAAVVEPAEVHALICKEGAQALGADYALLYVPENEKQLQPVAIYSSEQEKVSPFDWPHLPLDEEERQAFYAQEPTVLDITRQTGIGSTKPLLSQRHIHALTPIGYHVSAPRKYQSGYLALSLWGRLARKNVRTALLVPLFTGGEPVSLLVFARCVPVESSEKKSFHLLDIPRAQAFAEQAAIAFTNAMNYEQSLEAQKRLRELDQLKDQFMITASHELRTPLTAVQGYLELLSQYDEVLTPDQRRDFMQKVQRSCDELVVLLSNVMDASRLEVEAGIRAAHIERVSVKNIIQSVINLIEPQLTKEQRRVHLKLLDDMVVLADPARLRQILMNISVNALKYSQPGTPLFFSAHIQLEGDHTRYGVISISDRGKGIAPADQPRLFERFVRLENDMNSPVRGSGLGLYISRRLIEAMQGKIWLESKGVPGEGSTFFIALPIE